MTGEWKRLHNEELYGVYYSTNNIRVIKSRRMRWEVHVARMGERRGACGVLVGRLKGKRPLERPKHSWKDNIKWIFKTLAGGHGLDCCGSGQAQVAGACEKDNECSSSIECG